MRRATLKSARTSSSDQNPFFCNLQWAFVGSDEAVHLAPQRLVLVVHAAVDDLLLERADESLGDPVGLGLARQRQTRRDPQAPKLHAEPRRSALRPVIGVNRQPPRPHALEHPFAAHGRPAAAQTRPDLAVAVASHGGNVMSPHRLERWRERTREEHVGREAVG